MSGSLLGYLAAGVFEVNLNGHFYPVLAVRQSFSYSEYLTIYVQSRILYMHHTHRHHSCARHPHNTVLNIAITHTGGKYTLTAALLMTKIFNVITTKQYKVTAQT